MESSDEEISDEELIDIEPVDDRCAELSRLSELLEVSVSEASRLLRSCNESSELLMERYLEDASLVRREAGLSEVASESPAEDVVPMRLPNAQGQSSTVAICLGDGGSVHAARSVVRQCLTMAHMLDEGDSAAARVGLPLLEHSDEPALGLLLRCCELIDQSQQPLVLRLRGIVEPQVDALDDAKFMRLVVVANYLAVPDAVIALLVDALACRLSSCLSSARVRERFGGAADLSEVEALHSLQEPLLTEEEHAEEVQGGTHLSGVIGEHDLLLRALSQLPEAKLRMLKGVDRGMRAAARAVLCSAVWQAANLTISDVHVELLHLPAAARCARLLQYYQPLPVPEQPAMPLLRATKPLLTTVEGCELLYSLSRDEQADELLRLLLVQHGLSAYEQRFVMLHACLGGRLPQVGTLLAAAPQLALGRCPDLKQVMHTCKRAAALGCRLGTDRHLVVGDMSRLIPNATDSHSFLHVAATAEVARCLVEAGADVEAIGCIGHRPLHTAAHFGHTTTVAYLLSIGADPTVCSSCQLRETPLNIAENIGSVEVAQILRDALS